MIRSHENINLRLTCLFLDRDLDVPLKYLLLAKCHCLSMFALKIILKNVQMADVECSYVDEVVVKQSGKDAMILAIQVAFDVFSGNPIDYLKTDEENIKKNNVSHPKSDPFALELFSYITNKEDLFTNTEKPHEKLTRAVNFSIQEAKKTCDDYINVLWQCIEKRVELTDFSPSQCAFSEAAAETVFSIYGRVTEGRESMSISNAVGLTRIALHGPPVSTDKAKKLAEEALQLFPSKYGPRFLTHLWFKGATSKVIKKVQNKEWDF